MINAMDRLGTPGSRHDIKALKNHPFFAGLDFNNLKSHNLKELLQKEEEE